MTDEQDWRQRGLLWTSMAFYLLIALEFFYMASPFAVYFYGVYGPGLDWLGQSSITSGLLTFFMPHIAAETRSWFVDAHTIIGLLLFVGGFLAFVFGAVQVYSRKLLRGQEVRGGLYREIRHPQYLALMIASFGMLLIWPRFLVLLGFIVVMFIYILLAKIEERRCLRQYDGYAEYLESTGAFLPRSWERPFRFLELPSKPLSGFVSWAVILGILLGLAYLVGLGIQRYSIYSLYTIEDDQSVTISVSRLSDAEIEKIRSIALNNSEVSRAVVPLKDGQGTRLINYVVPTEMYISEIPMHLPEGSQTGHLVPENFNRSRYKIVFTKAALHENTAPKGRAILRNAINKEPIVEAWVDLERNKVEAVFSPPQESFYNGIPVPVY